MEARTRKPIDLFLASDSGSQLGLVVTVESVLANCGPETRIALHVADCGLDPALRSRMAAVWTGHRAVDSVRFHELSMAPYQKFMLRNLRAAALARMRMPDLVPSSRAVYLDTDILFLGDIQELADADLGGAPVGAVREGYHATLGDAGYDLQGLPFPVPASAPYFNSGVLVADLDAWRRESVWEKGIALLSGHREKFTHNDQSVLNILFAGRACILAGRWNRQRQLFDELPLLVPPGPGAIHFIGPVKPWHFAARRGCGAVSRWHEQRLRSRVDPPLDPPVRGYRGPLVLLWGRKLFQMARMRLRRAL